MAARHPDRRRRRGRQLHRQLPEPVIGHARRALHRSANHSGAAAKVASRRSGGRGLPSRLSHSGVRPSHQPPAAVPWHSLSSPESRRQRDRTRDRCSAATEYTAGRVVILVRCACGNGTVAPSQARTLHLSASGPGGLLESRPELHTDLVMNTRGCSWKPLATGRLSQGGGVRTERHASVHGLAGHPTGCAVYLRAPCRRYRPSSTKRVTG